MAAEPSASPRPSKPFVIVTLVLVVGGFAGLGLFLQHRQTQTDNAIAYNEARVAGSLNELATAQVLYRERTGNYGTLADLASNRHVEAELGLGARGGYRFTVQVGADPQASWWASADPVAPGASGERHFYIDQRSQIYVSHASIAGPLADPPPAGVSQHVR